MDESGKAYIDSQGQVAVCNTIANCADAGCSNDGCTQCNAGYYLDADGTCQACSDTLQACATCSSATSCDTCSHESFIVNGSGLCVCDNTGKENMVLNAETGLCSCEDGYHMHETFGCLSCQYMIPGCASCSEVYWDTGIPLDNIRMKGPDNTSCDKSLTCDACQLNERYVSHSWNFFYQADDFAYL